MLHVDTIMGSWGHADATAQVIGAIRGHARNAVRRLDAASGLASGGDDRKPSQPSQRWSRLLDDLQDGLGRSGLMDEYRRREQFDRAMRVAAAFLAAEALTVTSSVDTDAERGRLEVLIQPVFEASERLQDFADAAPTEESRPYTESPGLVLRSGRGAPAWPLWTLCATPVAVLALATALALLTGALTALYWFSFLVMPPVLIASFFALGYADRVRAPYFTLSEERRLSELTRAGRVLDSQASYLKLYRVNTRDLRLLVRSWSESTDRRGYDGVVRELNQIQASLDHSLDLADSASDLLADVAQKTEHFGDQFRWAGDRRDLAAPTALDRGRLEALSGDLREHSRRAAWHASNLLLHAGPPEGSRGPLDFDPVAVAVHLSDVAHGLDAGTEQSILAIKSIIKVVSTLIEKNPSSGAHRG